jgi:hypothetical protein
MKRIVDLTLTLEPNMRGVEIRRAVCHDILEFSARVLVTYACRDPKRAGGRHYSEHLRREHLSTGDSRGWVRTAGRSTE